MIYKNISIKYESINRIQIKIKCIKIGIITPKLNWLKTFGDHMTKGCRTQVTTTTPMAAATKDRFTIADLRNSALAL